MMGDKLIIFSKVCLLALLVMVNTAQAQFSGMSEDPLLSKQYDRLVGVTIDEILPPPENPTNEYARYKAKIEKKLRGEANEELLVTLVALGVTYTPAASNELASIISGSNTYLNGEMGAIQASGILAQGLDALYNEIKDLNADEASVQLEVLRNYRKSITFLRQAIEAKHYRYQSYGFSSSLSQGVITNERNYLNACYSGAGPSQGVGNFLPRLANLKTSNTNQISSLTTTIEADLNALSLSLTTTIADLDVLIADAATPAADVPKLEKIKADKIKKDELIVQNGWINTCQTEFTPYPSQLMNIKDEEDVYMVGVMDSMNDISGETALPTLGTTYQSFNMSAVCASPPPGFPLTDYLNRMRSDCSTWINYYKSPFMIPPVNNSPTAAKADERYKKLSNCTARGRTCNDTEFNRLAGELKAISVFPMGRIFVVDMLNASLDYAKLFYADLLGNPMFVDCEISQQTDLQKFYCYSAQKTSTECMAGLGIDCERAEVGYLFYKFKLDTEKDSVQFATEQLAGGGQDPDAPEGFANLGNFDAPDTGNVLTGSGFTPPSGTNVNGTNSVTGSSVTDNTREKSAKLQGPTKMDSSKFTAPDPKSLAYRGQSRAAGGSKMMRDYIKDTYVKNSKLKFIKDNKNKAGFADKVMGDLSKMALGKLAGSYTAKENLFASYQPDGSRGKEIDLRKSKHSQKLASLASINSGSSTDKSLFGGGSLGKKVDLKEEKEEARVNKKDEKNSVEEKKELSAAEKAKNEPVFNLISERYKKSFDKLGLEENPLAGVIHSRKSDLFEIVSRRYKKTKIYHDHSHQP
jgi:hypothetical protein